EQLRPQFQGKRRPTLIKGAPFHVRVNNFVAEGGYFHSVALRNQIHAPNLFHDFIRERKDVAFPGIDAFHKNQVACGQPPTHIVIELLRADVNHWEKKKFKTGAVLFHTVDGGTHVEGILFDELHITGSANKRSGAGTPRECSTRLPDRSNRACSSHAPNRDSP